MKDLIGTGINKKINGPSLCYTIEVPCQRRDCLITELEKLLVQKGKIVEKDPYLTP